MVEEYLLKQHVFLTVYIRIKKHSMRHEIFMCHTLALLNLNLQIAWIGKLMARCK